MEKLSVVTVGLLAALLLATACTSQATGSGAEVVDPNPTPPKQSLDEADASVPSDTHTGSTAKCGGFSFSSNACGTCGMASCCDEAAACQGDTECTAILACTKACTSGDSACVTSCEVDHPSGATKLQAFGACAVSKCDSECSSGTTPPAASRGIGDPCTTSADCHDGTCNAGTSGKGWCTTSCTQNTDCAGYPQLDNQEGEFNFCLTTKAGSSSCFPGCTTSADCTQYGSGITCQTITSTGAHICSL